MAYMLIFLLKKKWVAFAFAKATHIFQQKNTCELDIVLTRTVNILTTNELVNNALNNWAQFDYIMVGFKGVKIM